MDFFISNSSLILAIVSGVLIIAISVSIFLFIKLKKRTDIFFEGAKIENVEKILTEHLKNLKNQGKDIQKIFEEISRMDLITQKSFQKIETIRYNPFNDTGGDQSFSIVLLDAKNNGFIITSLYTRGDTRVYAKPIKEGISEYALSEEESQVLGKAIKS
jgi:uncharacterized protein YpmB